MKDPKVFPAFFVTDEEGLGLEEIRALVEAKAKELKLGKEHPNWMAIGTGTTYIVVPKEAIPYGEATGLFTDMEEEA